MLKQYSTRFLLLGRHGTHLLSIGRQAEHRGVKNTNMSTNLQRHASLSEL